jgi:hypothetical protein
MTRRLEFCGVAHSYDGEVLLPLINDVISPYSAYLQVSPDGSLAQVDLPDAVPDTIDPLVGEVVNWHAKQQLKEYRDEALETIRAYNRSKEGLAKLTLQWRSYKTSAEYQNTFIDRILETHSALIKDVIRRLEDGL